MMKRKLDVQLGRTNYCLVRPYKSLSLSLVAFGNEPDLVNSTFPRRMSPISTVSIQATV